MSDGVLETAPALAADFRLHADWGRRLHSPFTEALLLRCADDISEEGRLFQLLRESGPWHFGDALPLRMAGALNAAGLSGRDAALAAAYPPRNTAWRMESVWPLVDALIERDRDWLRAFIAHPPQTNETRRAMALMPAFQTLSQGPLHMLELGASAGLNQHWDKFAYRGDGWRWGDGKVDIAAQWRGKIPDFRPLAVASRAGCDVNPLDIAAPEQRLRLRSYIWPDMAERLARFDAAAELALQHGVSVARADAGDWLAAALSAGPPEGTTIIYHSVAWRYFSAETRARAVEAMARAGAAATPERRLAWVRLEEPYVFGHADGAYVIDAQVWPGGETRVLGRADPHCYAVEWFG